MHRMRVLATPQAEAEQPSRAAATAAKPTIDVKALRHCLGQFGTGVTVIATRAADGHLVGLTANSFGALSLEPPLITWALRVSSPSLPAFDAAERFEQVVRLPVQ